MKCIIAVATVLLLAIGSSQADYHAKGYGKPAAHYGGGHGGHHVPCGSNLLLSCHPNVAQVPCVPAHGGHHEYHHAAPAAHHAAPAYHHAPAPAPAYHHAPAPVYHHAPAPAKY
ncbi:vitelline membrane protein 15a-1-like [Anopheles maculipalpis]|uniref:vitelline membrane protein 15a-1-like n=1 Tax=Anopheles maculipalpis TaxID=1496333 RepID=UPI0021591439|nr:vitelline membrane protein 15a-1-like [Anopheles maculipalpis]